MISYETWVNYQAENHKFVEIFDTSNCYGIEGPKKTTFSESLHNTNSMIKSNEQVYYYEIKRQNILKQ